MHTIAQKLGSLLWMFVTFEAAIEGRDVISNKNQEYCTFITLNKPVYDAGGKLLSYQSISDNCNQYYQNNNLSTNIPAKVTDLAKNLRNG